MKKAIITNRIRFLGLFLISFFSLINLVSAKESCGPFPGSWIFRIAVELIMILLIIFTVCLFIKNKKLKGGKK